MQHLAAPIAERYGWPCDARAVLDLIESAAIAVERGGCRRVGVVATAATVGAGSYGRTLRARVGGIDVVEVPAPALVPLVEAGRTAAIFPALRWKKSARTCRSISKLSSTAARIIRSSKRTSARRWEIT